MIWHLKCLLPDNAIILSNRAQAYIKLENYGLAIQDAARAISADPSYPAVEDDEWQAQFERALCVKIFRGQGELEGWDVAHREAKDLFFYQSRLPFGDYVDSQENSIRTLFRNYNTGEGKGSRSNPAGDMCSGVKAIFGDGASDAVYSVIHSRSLEGEPGVNLLGKVSRRSGFDPRAAL